MSLYLFATTYTHQLSPSDFSGMLNLVPKRLQLKILNYRRWQDSHASLLGRLLLRAGLVRMGLSGDLNQLQFTSAQKPYIPGYPDFNISHSGDRVVCIFNTRGRVGIDIECMTDISFDDFQTQFTESEWAVIRSSPAPVAEFYQFWTAKESLIKADGRGLEIPLRDIDLSVSRSIHFGGNSWLVSRLQLFDGFACHVTVDGSLAADDLPEIEFHELSTGELKQLPPFSFRRNGQ